MQGSDNRPEEDSLQAAVTFILPVAGQMVSLLERSQTWKSYYDRRMQRHGRHQIHFPFSRLTKSFPSLFEVYDVSRLCYQKSEQIFTSLENG